MIKKDIARILYERHGGITFQEAEDYVNQLIELMKEATEEDQDLTITHFGKFRHKSKTVREIQLPSGAKQLTHSGTRLQFIPSAKLKTRINASND